MPASARPALCPGDYISQLSIDCVIFGYREAQLHVLVPKPVFAENVFALPGGFIRHTESIDQAARRILEGRTGIRDIYLDQFRVFGAADRSNRLLAEQVPDLRLGEDAGATWIRNNLTWLTQRFVSIGYYALVDMAKVIPNKAAFDSSLDWHPVEDLPRMMMDHHHIVHEALLTLRRQLDEKLIAFNLLPEKFTMKELRLLYEAVYDRPFARNNFQKKILNLGVLERLEKHFTGASNRAPYLYRFQALETKKQPGMDQKTAGEIG